MDLLLFTGGRKLKTEATIEEARTFDDKDPNEVLMCAVKLIELLCGGDARPSCSIGILCQAYFGRIPTNILSDNTEYFKILMARNNLKKMHDVMMRAYKLYFQTRGVPSKSSNRRAKALSDPGLHPLFMTGTDLHCDC